MKKIHDNDVQLWGAFEAAGLTFPSEVEVMEFVEDKLNDKQADIIFKEMQLYYEVSIETNKDQEASKPVALISIQEQNEGAKSEKPAATQQIKSDEASILNKTEPKIVVNEGPAGILKSSKKFEEAYADREVFDINNPPSDINADKSQKSIRFEDIDAPEILEGKVSKMQEDPADIDAEQDIKAE